MPYPTLQDLVDDVGVGMEVPNQSRINDQDVSVFDADTGTKRLFANAKAHLTPYVWHKDKETAFEERFQLASSVLFRVQNTKNRNTHVVVLSAFKNWDNPDVQFSLHCGDAFLEGKASADARKADYDKALAYAKDAGKAAAAAHLENAIGYKGAFGKGAGCHFWSKFHVGEYCAHTGAVLQALKDAGPHFIADLQLAMFASVAGASPNGASTQSLAPCGFTLETLAFKVPALLEGDRGSGKTHAVRAYARQQGLPLVLQGGHESVESWELLGQYVPTGSGQPVWKDGKISQAFRLAQTQKVVLLLDELLRIPQRQLSVLLTALSPFEGHYTLSTGRIVDVVDGVGVEEVLSCPVENLWVVATTNVGAEFALDELDPAVAERFVPLRKDTEVGELKRLLQEALASKGFDESLAEKLAVFYEALHQLVNQGMLNKAPTTRTMLRAVELAQSQGQLADALQVQALLWVERDSAGRPVQEQLNAVQSALEYVRKAS